jgi:predicted PurR-regulated permease PerM
MPQKETEYSFVQRVWIITGIVSFAVVILLLLKTVFSVLLLVLAGALIAIFFRSLAGLIQKKTKWSSTVCLLISTIGSFLLIALVCWLIGAKVQAQVAELSETLPATIEKTKSHLQSTPLGEMIVEKLSSPETADKLNGVAKQLFSTTFGVLGDL